MSFSCVKSILSVSGRIVRQQAALTRVSAPLAAVGGCRSLTRSMWLLCRAPHNKPQKSASERAIGWTKMCGCCGLHTEGDKDIIEFLDDEIKYESKNEKKSLPQVKGFEVTKAEGPNVELTRSLDNETVVIKFNINNTIDDESGMEFTDPPANPEDEDPLMVSRPPFIVEFTKGGNKTLAVQCMFPADRFPGSEQGEPDQGEYEDLIEIEDVALLHKGAKWEDASYTLTGANMDGNLYAMILNMMDERGITADFVKELVDFSTAYEHKKYIEFLGNLQNFVASK